MFKLTKILNGRINVPEPLHFVVGATAVKAGEALNLTDGKLVAASGKPSFVSFADADAGKTVAVYAVTPDMVFEVGTTAAPTSLKVGDKVTITSTGVTDTTSNGVATIIDLLGASVSGDKVLVIFE